MCNRPNDVQATELAVQRVEESVDKRRKRNKPAPQLEFNGDSVVLPPAVVAWLLHIGVDVERYQRALYQVAKGLKKRYYRMLSSSDQSSEVAVVSKPTSSELHVREDVPFAPDQTHEETDADGSLALNSSEGLAHDSTISLGEDSGCNTNHTKQPSPQRHSHVRWLRDVELYECYSKIPEGAIGLDAASAAIIDALRLSELAQKDECKWILDVCCAPGGKLLGTVSTVKRLWGDKINCKIIGLDIVKRRLDVCASLLKRENAPRNIDVHLLNCSGQSFTEFEGESMIERFDRVIVDAECTHEGSLRSVVRTLKYWGIQSLESRFTEEHAKSVVSNQRELLRHAIRLIRPGGMVVYSTCSLHDEQNEILVASVIEEFDNVQLRQLPLVQCDCCSTVCDRPDAWPATSTEHIIRKHCSPRYLPNREVSSEASGCSNITSPVCVRFSPLSPDTDGIFVVSIVKLPI
ncbi:S-adenosyl-L-methionine-dependent methyltransferase superfamily protein [Babesia ovata]|uniref:S-adenosyl-L-methionine-dependent methyltransferase superfamily protein n=1 Tax=Babesia ovata TaxID=189622 RepID=A0A2H6KHG6_9APIC|nr:S-adenosyl-L-methionine-dependent methyltransferase superfamily protein [Babesia ovata]GBE62435.1 S-adenosyl-L-methionine-dependent methyltransferase superfamily protein [Babesia ovata]